MHKFVKILFAPLFFIFETAEALSDSKYVLALGELLYWGINAPMQLIFLVPVLLVRLFELVGRLFAVRIDEAVDRFLIGRGYDIDPPERVGFKLKWSFGAIWNVSVISFERPMPSQLVKPPLSTPSRVLRFLCPPKVYERVFEPTISDCQIEYNACLADGRIWDARKTEVYYWFVLINTFSQQTISKTLGWFLGLVIKRGTKSDAAKEE